MDAVVLVEDGSEISGCSLVFTTTKGKKLIPVEGSWPLGSVPFRPGERLMIQFVPLEGGVNPCLLEAETVKVLHYQRPKEGSAREHLEPVQYSMCCAWTQDAFKVPWMERVIRQTDPYRITRFGYGGLAAYRFQSAGADLIFDCLGNLIDDGSDLQARSQLMAFLDNAFVIMVRNQRS